MGTVTAKICVVCGADVSQQKRTKDMAGNYYCDLCLNARRGHSTPVQPARGGPPDNPTPKPSRVTKVTPPSPEKRTGKPPFWRQRTTIILAAFLVAVAFVVTSSIRKFQANQAYVSKTLREAAGIEAPEGNSEQVDPGKSFEELAQRFREQLSARFANAIQPNAKFRIALGFPETVSFNVEKTNSLVNPIVGTIWIKDVSVKYGNPVYPPVDTTANLMLTAFFKEGRWKFNVIEGRADEFPTYQNLLTMDAIDDLTQTFREEVGPKIKTSFDVAARSVLATTK